MLYFLVILFYVMGSRGRGWLFSIFLLCRMIDPTCYIPMVLISLNVFLMLFSGISNVVSKSFIEGE